MIRRLDHIAIAVRDTAAALEYYGDRLGLPVVSTEELDSPRVRLTYIDVGNAFIQLVEPLDDESAVALHIAAHGEGLHHLCFGVDGDVVDAARSLSEPGAAAVTPGQGRGRVSAFATERRHGVLLETTSFS